MENLIDWIIGALSIDGINSKGLVKATLEDMTIDDWYALRNACNDKIASFKSQGFLPESNPNILTLKSYQADAYQCELLNREIELLSNFVKGPNYSGMPIAPSKCSNPVEQQHINLIGAKHKLEKLLTQKADKLSKCLKIIDGISDSRGKYIISSIFLDNKDLTQVMIDAPFDLCYRQLIRIKKAALDEIRKMEVG
ncbi:MAG: hypothetical protein ACI35S_05355 [Anaeroplasma sp.]